jgi:hypothetical protein
MPTESITQEIKARIRRVHDTDTPLFSVEAKFVIVAVIAGLIALVAWLLDLRDPRTSELLEGVSAVARIGAVLGGLGYLSRSAESRTHRLIARLLADAERADADGYARGYVAGVRRETPAEASHLRSVN